MKSHMPENAEIPAGIKRNGQSYQWVVTHIREDPDYGMVDEAMANGWQKVIDDLGVSIERDGCILMERPREMVKAATKENFERAVEQQRECLAKAGHHPDLPQILTSHGWMPSAEYRAMETRLDNLWETFRDFKQLMAQMEGELAQMRATFGLDD